MGHPLPEVLQRRSEETGNVAGKVAFGPWPLVVGPSPKRIISKVDVEKPLVARIIVHGLPESMGRRPTTKGQRPTAGLSPSSVLVAIPMSFP